MTLEGNTLLQIQKGWGSYTFFQSLPKNNSWAPYKKLKADNYDITKFLLPPDTHSKYVTAKKILKNSQ